MQSTHKMGRPKNQTQLFDIITDRSLKVRLSLL